LSENGCETKYILYTTFFEKTSLGQWRFRRNVPYICLKILFIDFLWLSLYLS